MHKIYLHLDQTKETYIIVEFAEKRVLELLVGLHVQAPFLSKFGRQLGHLLGIDLISADGCLIKPDSLRLDSVQDAVVV